MSCVRRADNRLLCLVVAAVRHHEAFGDGNLLRGDAQDVDDEMIHAYPVDTQESRTVKTKVRRFWLQSTPSFADGAPQRENYLDDRAFDRACVHYANEWRQSYVCNGCDEVECPQCGAQGSTANGPNRISRR